MQYTKRLQKELQKIQSTPIEGITVGDVSNLQKWVVQLDGAKGTLYEGEHFTLQFCFPNNYPLESPEVIFIGNVPIHEHVYSNGHICLNVLYDGWSPVLSVSTICLSLQSMLSSATQKVRPRDNDNYVRNCFGKSPKQGRWLFHDDKV
ncbi:ubiquitin conjugating enzyme E2 [Acrasis kona]|uniref:Ubiquitin conjugating enzyme E2 n=1 Tax=Acrasis kona TaxID=1008807 RepID=A0AAW2ZMY6_9EUKA